MQKIRGVMRYAWFPLIVVIWLGLHVHFYLDPPSTPQFIDDTPESVEEFFQVPSLGFQSHQVDMRSLYQDTANSMQFALWKTAYILVWIYLCCMGGVYYISLFYDKEAHPIRAEWEIWLRDVYIDTSVIFIVMYVVVLWQ